MRATLDKRPGDVARMFDEVARSYDRANAVQTFGLERRYWRPQLVAEVAPKPGQRILDLAAGTGASSLPLAGPGVELVACDFSAGMLAVGKQKHPELDFVAGDATRLPFDDDSFDTVTISFGLRNIVDPVAGLREMRRVTRPGGRLVVLEVSTPPWTPMRLGSRLYLNQVVPRLARVVSSDAAAYAYLAESSVAWPDAPGVADLVVRAGWSRVAFRRLTGGVVALHRGTELG